MVKRARIVGTVLAVATTIGLITGCASNGDRSPEQDAESGPQPPMSSSVPPTLARPTRPPTVPTDPRPGVIVAGRVTAVHDDRCRDVIDAAEQTWSLTGPIDTVVRVGDDIRFRVKVLDQREADCGTGIPARVISTRTDAR